MTGPREDAAQLDRAIDALLRGPVALRALPEGELAATARLLLEALPRLHPRFGFEELLAGRLARAGAPVVRSEPTPISSAGVRVEADREAGPTTVPDRWRRSLVAGGAIASGVSLALPLAGAALIVWRRSRTASGIL